MNLYGFVYNNPQSFVDDKGKMVIIFPIDDLIEKFLDRYIPRDDPGRPFARQLIMHYAFGFGGDFVREDGAWGAFMKDRPELQAALNAKMQEVVRKLCKGGADSGKVNETLTGVRLNQLASMRMTLHGAQRIEIKDDFTVQGRGTACCRVTFKNLKYTWVDRGDLHPGTKTELDDGSTVDDSFFERLSHWIPSAGPYDIRITWSADSQWFDDGKTVQIEWGWPSSVAVPPGGGRF